MKYKITYLDSYGNRKVSIEEALDQKNLVETLKLRGFKIISISEANNEISLSQLNKNKKLNQKTITNFLRQFSILLKSGINIKQGISILKDQEKDKNLQSTLESIENNLNLGYTLSQSFMLTDKFPELVYGVVEGGEVSSKLAKSMEILADYYYSEEKTNQMLKNALYYPCILLAVTFFVVSIIVTFVLPNYIKLFESYENIEMPYLTKLLMDLSKFSGSYGLVIIIIIILLLMSLPKLLSNNSKVLLSKNLIKLPIIGTYIINYETQRFSGIFSLLISSGIETIESVKIAANSLKNLYFKREVQKSTINIVQGNTLYQSFSKIDEFPKMFINLVNVGEVSSNLVETMDISFNYYKELVNEQSKKLTSLFEPIIIIIVSIIVGSIVIAIALPTFSIINII